MTSAMDKHNNEAEDDYHTEGNIIMKQFVPKSNY